MIKRLRLKKKEDRRLRRGHPWAFSNEFSDTLAGVMPGELVAVEDFEGKPVGVGYANPHSLIAVRILTRRGEEVGYELIRDRIEGAKRLRERFYPKRTSFRAVFSESDFLPGLIVDRYGGWLVVQSLTAGMERLMPEVLSALGEVYSPEGVVIRNDSRLRLLEGLPLEKRTASGDYHGAVQVEIAGLRFKVDLMEGQKTGFFLDQVDNYRLLEGICEGERVLDLFCCTGAWSLAALLAGASSATGIDSSRAAIDIARENARENGLEGADFVEEDAFDAAKRLAGAGERYGVVVADPPAFIKSRAKIAEGLKGYRDLNVRAVRLVRPDGYLITSSCSHHLSREAFLDMLRESAAATGRSARILEIRSQSRDHPALLAAPETEYLKCALLQIS